MNLKHIKKGCRLIKPQLFQKIFNNFSSDNASEFTTIYKQDSNNIGAFGLIGGSFLSTLLTENFAIPLCLGTMGFAVSTVSCLMANEIKYNLQKQQLILNQKRRMLIFGPNEYTVHLNQLNVLYLGQKCAFININSDDNMKTYLLALSEEENQTLIQLLQKRKNN